MLAALSPPCHGGRGAEVGGGRRCGCAPSPRNGNWRRKTLRLKQIDIALRFTLCGRVCAVGRVCVDARFHDARLAAAAAGRVCVSVCVGREGGRGRREGVLPHPHPLIVSLAAAAAAAQESPWVLERFFYQS